MIRDNREYRSFPLGETKEEFKVYGYASTFDPYVLFEVDGNAYSERIAPNAFDGVDMSDVIFLKDHSGTVFARISNGTISLKVDERGLYHETDLSKTSASREMFDEIRTGMYTQMSFAFTVAEDHYEKETRTRVIDKFKKIYDISAVSIPANPNTEIGVSARSFFDGFIEKEKQEFAKRAEKELKKRKLKLLLELEEMK